MTRRELLALAPAAVLAKPGYDPKIAAQVYVWTQRFDKLRKNYGDGTAEMLAAFKKTGYRRIELTSGFLTSQLRDRTAGLLKEYGIEVPIVYAGGAMHTPEVAAMSIAEILAYAEAAQSIGAHYINTNPSPKAGMQRKTDEELATQAKYVNELGAKLRDRGMRLLLHHHNPEMADDAREWRHLFRNTDPALVGLCIDIDWVFQGGQRALPILKEAGKRVESLHLRNAMAGTWTESLGEGEYNYRAIADYLRSMDYAGYLVVELAHRPNTKITRSLEDDLKLSREFAEKTFGVKA